MTKATILKVKLSNENGSEIVEFSSDEVIEHHGFSKTWDEIGADLKHPHEQQSLAEDFALFKFKRQYGDQGDYQTDLV